MEVENLFFILAKPFIHHISAVMLFVLLFNLGFFLLYPLLKKREILKKRSKLRLFLILSVIFFGIYLRLSLAYFGHGNHDLRSYEIVSNLILKGENVYAKTYRYNYSPLWFLILGFLKRISFCLSLAFIVRFFLTLVDLASLYFLFKISKIKKIAFEKIAVGFFLNPISIILTGYHGQFENLTILFILVGIFFYYKNKSFNKFSFISFTLAGIIKHSVFNQILIFLNKCFKKRKKIVLFFSLSTLLFLSTFLPYWKEGSNGIIKNVFMYGGLEKRYGISYFLVKLGLANLIKYYKYFFIALLFSFPFFFKKKDLAMSCLGGFLTFLSFTSGISDQYFVLPVAIGSITNSLFFYLYTLMGSLYLFGSSAQLDIQKYKLFSSNFIWLIVIFWFFKEIYDKKN